MAFWNERVKFPKSYFDVITGESSIGFEMPTSVSTFNCHRYSIAQRTNEHRSPFGFQVESAAGLLESCFKYFPAYTDACDICVTHFRVLVSPYKTGG